MKHGKWVVSVLIGEVIFLLIVGLIYGSYIIIKEENKRNGQVSINIGKELENINDVELQVKELRKILKEFYIYNMSNLRKDLSDKELIEEGGVCRHYSEWYVDKAREIGLYGKTVTFYGEDEKGHEIAILYDKDMSEYCIADQTELVGCVRLRSVD